MSNDEDEDEISVKSETEWKDPYASKAAPVEDSKDLQRILALPRRAPVEIGSTTAEAIIELEMQKYSLGDVECKCAEMDPQIAAGKRECLKRLNHVQAWSLREMSMVGGCLLSVAVGAGKTGIGILAPLALGLKPDELAVLLVPPSLLNQFGHDYELIAQHFRVPAVTLHFGTASRPRTWPRGGVPTLHVLSYNALSGEANSDLLDRIGPVAIIADECDGLGDRTSARTCRVLRAFLGDNDTPREERRRRLSTMKFVGMTGSITDSQIEEVQHLSALALRKYSPFPLDFTVAEQWGKALNASDNPAPAGELERFCGPNETVRQAFGRRVRETPGFVVFMDHKVVIKDGERAGQEVKMHLSVRQPPKIPDKIQEALRMVRAGERPDTLIDPEAPFNETLNDPMEIARHAQTVALGLVLRWKFPPIKGVPQDRDHILKWYAYRRSYTSEQREQILKGQRFLDSAKNCENAAMRFHGDLPKDPNRPSWACKSWPAWREIRDTVQWEEDAQWLDDWLAKDAAEWALSNTGIVWYTVSEFGRRVKELTGLNLHDGGPGAEKRLRAEIGDKSIIASLKSNGRGRNGLQFVFNKQLVTGMPSSSKIWEQAAGRTVRRGQSDDVYTEIYQHTKELRKALRAAILRGDFNQDLWEGTRHLNAAWAAAGGTERDFLEE